MAIMQIKPRSYWSVLLSLLLPVAANAAVPAWKIIPEKSTITFTATQNNAPVAGQFEKFTGEINFDPNQLKLSNVHIVIDMNSVTTSYKQIADTLKTSDWFDTTRYSQTIYTASTFIKNADNTYQAQGRLTMRGKSLPTNVIFTLVKYTNTEAQVTGATQLQRTAYGIGQGDWANTGEIKDEVQVKFVLNAVKK